MNGVEEGMTHIEIETDKVDYDVGGTVWGTAVDMYLGE
jgi:hypothetical protein